MRLNFSPIIKSTARDTVKDALAAAEVASLKLLFAQRQFCMDYYHNEVLLEDGGADDYLKNYFGTVNENGKWVYLHNAMLEHIPVTEQLIDLKARNYINQPERKVGDKAAKNYTESLKKSGWFSTSKLVEQQTQLLHDIAVGVFVDEVTGLLKYQVITQYFPIFDEDDAFGIDPVAIIYPTAKRGTGGEVIYAYWDKDVFAEIEGEAFIVREEQPNTYKVFNFFFPHRKKPLSSHFGTPRSHLATANKNIDISLSALNHLMRYNGFKQMVFIGETDGSEAKFIMGASRTLTIKTSKSPDESEPRAEVLDMQANFAEHVNAIKFAMDRTTNAMNLKVDWNIQGGPALPGTLKLQSHQDLEDRESVIEILDEMIEQPLYRIVSAISKTFPVKCETGDFSTNFPEPQVQLSMQDELSQEKHNLELNLQNAVDLIMEEDPDLTEKLAIEKLLRNVRLNNLMRGSSEQIEEDTILKILAGEDVEITDNRATEQNAGQAGQGKAPGGESVQDMEAGMERS